MIGLALAFVGGVAFGCGVTTLAYLWAMNKDKRDE